MSTTDRPDTTDVTARPTAPSLPSAPRQPHVWQRPTGDTDDHYAWMRDVEDPRLLDYLTAENAYADAWFDGHTAAIDAIFGEIKSRVQETDLSTPVLNGGWWYAGSTVEGQSYALHHRGRTEQDATATLLLDENVEADGHDYFDLGAFDSNHDHTMFAWSTDTTGDERYTMRIRSFQDDDDGGAQPAVDLDDVITDVAHAGTAWSADGHHLFYVRPDDQQRPFQVWRHEVGNESSDDDTLIYQESDERFFVQVGETRSDKWILIHSGSQTSAEVRLIPSDQPTITPTIVLDRRDDIDYQIDDWGDRFVMVTNEGHDDPDDGEHRDAVDFRILECLANDDWTDPSAWTELVAHETGRRIIGVDAFASHLVVYEWAAAQPRLRILFRDGVERVVDLGPEPHDVSPSANPEWSTDTLRFATQSLTSPAALYDEDIVTGERTLLRSMPTPNVDLDQYVASRMWATSVDGTSVPIDIVRHVDTPLDGSAPACLYGYGSYEASMPPWFSIARLSLLDRGVVWALAHPRGGGELGRGWYLDGKLLNKQHTFDDMIASAEHLITSNVCASDRLAIRGGSAGGLLVGACTTQRPELFASVVAEVPFVDIVNTMSDTSLPLTVTEWEEWGDPRSEPFASAMLAYSPYDNTRPADYPAIYVSTGLNDPRVSVHEPAKWVARLREVATGDAPIVMRTELGAGHGGPTGRYDAWRDEARTLAFLLATT
ncbi:MAG: S9 family peptidase [Ilumatobacter sp.]|uniref:S9 family peptidase n=1 Tax=Ilumatobacter sp. TaxID=1967498 RepID=UPI003C78969D